jgi:hypothetical protein
MLISRAALAASWCIAVVLTGCRASSDFNEDVAKNTIESAPVKLEGEQVTFTDQQIQCGTRGEYWDTPVSLSPDHSTAHLTDKGRNLKFNDDVIMQDSTSHVPYVQVRGDFPLQVDSITSIKDGEDKTTKLAEAKVGVKIDDACFQSPLPLMGVKHGNFSSDSPVVFRLHFDESGWHVNGIVH